MPIYIISGHAERSNTYTQSLSAMAAAASSSMQSRPKLEDEITVPSGFEVRFFVDDNQELQNSEALNLYRDLMKDGTTLTVPNKVYRENEKMPNYYCWGMEGQYRDYSQIIRKTTKACVEAEAKRSYAAQVLPCFIDESVKITPIVDVKQSQPIYLSQIFETNSIYPGIVYWLCCTGAVQQNRVIRFSD